MKRLNKYILVSITPFIFGAIGVYVLSPDIARHWLPQAFVRATEIFGYLRAGSLPTDAELTRLLVVNKSELTTLAKMFVCDVGVKITVPGPLPDYDRRHNYMHPPKAYQKLFSRCSLKHEMAQGDGNYLLFPVYSEISLDSRKVEKGLAYVQDSQCKTTDSLDGVEPGAIVFRRVDEPWHLYLMGVPRKEVAPFWSQY